MSKSRLTMTCPNYRATLELRKDQTRRRKTSDTPDYQPGDVVRIAVPHWRRNTPETMPHEIWDRVTQMLRHRDGQNLHDAAFKMNYLTRHPDWHRNPSFLMPRAACLHEVRITDVRAERFCEISREDCFAEGIVEEKPPGDSPGYRYPGDDVAYSTPQAAFRAEIESLHPDEPDIWEQWCWVVEWCWIVEYEVLEGGE